MTRSTRVLAATVGLALLAAVAAGVAVADPDGTTSDGSAGDQGGFLGGDEEAANGSPVSILSDPLVLFVGLFVGTCAVTLVEYRRAGDEDEEADPDPDPPDHDPTERAGLAAGRAAARLSRTDPDPEALRREWDAMASALGIEDPERATPETVQRRALDAGLARDHALGLVDSYEVVRSGGGNDRREREAADALRGIHAAYAPEAE